MGGGYLTQSYPTNFHQFYKRKMLTKDEKIEDFMEVTEAEKTALEVKDAEWTKPPQPFIDEWNNELMYDTAHNLLPEAAQFGKYNEETGFFECNGVVDITYEEALEIASISRANNKVGVPYTAISNRWSYAGRQSCRTFWPIRGMSAGINPLIDYYNSFLADYKLEAISVRGHYIGTGINTTYSATFMAVLGTNLFEGCTNLKRIYSEVIFQAKAVTTAFKNCSKLEMLVFAFNNQDGMTVNLSWSPLWSYKSIKKTIANNKDLKKHWTFTVHPDVYEKLTDENNEEWHKLLVDAEAYNITFATI